jgi:copper chaperone CopZ
MHAIDFILIAVVAFLVILAVRRAGETWTGKRDCCSGEKSDTEKKFPKAHITDTDESHYPYTASYRIDGMRCANCAENVTRALDSVSETWATVDLAGGIAHILSKKPLDEDAYREAVEQAGYRLIEKRV